MLLTLTTNFFLFAFLFIGSLASGCNNTRTDSSDIEVNSQSGEVYEYGTKNYCFSEIADSLANAGTFKLNEEMRYRKVERSYLLRGKYKIEPEIEEFYEFTRETEAYILEHKDKSYLIMLGQAAGATGIGVDYTSYRCYLLDSNVKSLTEFGSLVNTPSSIFINDKGELSYIVIDENYPRPADGSDVVLNHYPMHVSVYTGDSIKAEFEYKCFSKTK